MIIHTALNETGSGLRVDGKQHPHPAVNWCSTEYIAASLAKNLYPDSDIVTTADERHELHAKRPTVPAEQAWWDKIGAMPIDKNTDPDWPFMFTVAPANLTGVAFETLAAAEVLYNAMQAVKPAWDQLGDLTKAVWVGKVLRGQTPADYVGPFPVKAESQTIFAEAILDPAEPNEALQKAAENHERLIEPEPAPAAPAKPLTLKERLALKGMG